MVSLAATPPATTSAVGARPIVWRKRSSPASVRSSTTSAIAAWKEAQKSATSLRAEGCVLLHRETQRRLQAGKGEVRAGRADQRTRQREAARIARPRRALDIRPAGIGEAEQFRGLVEGFAQRVVDGRAEPSIAADPFNRYELRMAAGDEQQQIGEGAARR